jgi:undecaprenyl-diphosphatase
LIDTSLHLGSLFAIIFYFKKDLLDIQNNQRLLSLIVIGSLPIMIIGYFLYTSDLIYLLRNTKVIAWTTLIFGIVLYVADKNNFSKDIKSNLNLKTILYIGFFQTLALIPGTSRAGITITAGRFLKFNRYDSSKISFLLSIPALTGASTLGLQDIFQQNFEFNYLVLIAISLSFLFSYFTVKFFLNFINEFSLNIFVLYRIIMGITLLIIVYN